MVQIQTSDEKVVKRDNIYTDGSLIVAVPFTAIHIRSQPQYPYKVGIIKLGLVDSPSKKLYPCTYHARLIAIIPAGACERYSNQVQTAVHIRLDIFTLKNSSGCGTTMTKNDE